MISFVEKMCINICKSMFKKVEKICGINKRFNLSTNQNITSHTFPEYSTSFYTYILLLLPINFFHYSTEPTNTTTNII